MKRLTILRHAKSNCDQPLDDFDRPLNERGWKAARRVGKELKRRRMRFDFGLASPAARVRETIDGIIETYGEPIFPIRFEPRLYLASTDILLELIRAIPDNANSALIVGHNPGLHALVLLLTREGGGLRRAVADNLPTAAVAEVEFRAGHWRELEPGSGELSALILPRALD